MHSKFLSAAFCMFIAAAPVVAQPQIKLQRTIGGNADDFLYSLSLTADGGAVVGGTSYSGIAGDKTQINRGAADYWMVKMDGNGRTKWDRTFGGSNNDNLKVIELTADGGYILGGSSESGISGEKTENSRGFNDYWIIKLDSLGQIQWDKTIGGLGQDYLSALTVTKDGGYIVGGYSVSNASGEKTERGRGNNDYWIVKLDSNGGIQWDKTIGGTGNDELSALIQTTDDGYILGGTSGSNISGEKTQDSRGGRGISDYWIIKLDNAGHIQWDKTIGGQSDDVLSGIIQTGDYGYLLGGSSASDISAEKKQNSKGSFDYWLVKTDALGKTQWSQTYGGNNYDNFSSLLQTSDGGYMLGGSSQSDISGDKTEAIRGVAGYIDYWVIKLDSRGKIQWDKTIGGGSDDNLKVIKEKGRNGYLLGGYSLSGSGYDKTTDNKGGYDYWLVKLKYSKPDSAITTLPITMEAGSTTKDKSFSVYPNPAKDVLHIQTKEEAVLSLSDQSGKIILTTTVNGKANIDISRLLAGIYCLKNNKTGTFQKLIINH